jgi:hypothetical protein
VADLDPRRDDDNAWSEEDAFYLDKDAEAAEDLEYEEPPPRSCGRFLAGWLACAVVLVFLGFVFIRVGERYHDPASRIPAAPVASLGYGLYGISRPLQAEYQSAQEFVPAVQTLSVEGRVERLEFPRTVADRLFGKRKEDALIFTARLPAGGEFRVLVLRDSGDPVHFALESPSRSSGSGIEGLFVGVGPGSTHDALIALMPAVVEAPRREHESAEFTIFGPFDRGDPAAIQERVAANPVLRHLATTLDEDDAGVSVAAPAFLILNTPHDRTINAIYQPASNLVMQPLWGENAVDSFAHELVHAYFDEVLPDETSAQREAQDYLEANQPHLYGDIVGDLYERLDRLGQAEEAIAFIVGAFAAEQPATVAPVRVLENQGLLNQTAGLLRSDAAFLVELGVLPVCMDPDSLGYRGETISYEYYDQVELACAREGR